MAAPCRCFCRSLFNPQSEIRNAFLAAAR